MAFCATISFAPSDKLVKMTPRSRLKNWRIKLWYHLNSNTPQTATMVLFMVFVSVGLSIWLFWRSLYVPELKNHANYLANQIMMIHNSRQDFANQPDKQAWVLQHAHLSLIKDPDEFPVVSDKIFAQLFTDILSKETSRQLGRPIQIYFKFKPTPKLWIYDAAHPDIWLQEPITHYSRYSTTPLGLFVFGLPLLTLAIIIWLVRALNRPLKRLERAASHYIQFEEATILPTQSGSNEIRQVNTAFNRLFYTLNQSQKERTIMLAGISHDLRTPLTRMRLTAEMLPDEFFKEGLIYDIEDMDAILEQFISFMKDGSDEPVRPTNLESICKEIIIQFAEVNFIFQNTLTQAVPVRPLSIKRLLINLINNAIRYGRQPIHLVLSMTSTIHHPTVLLLCVKDEGDGVDDSQLERIMQPFERGETARTTQGSGLGLAIVARIAKLHQGWVEAINHPEGGLQVCVYIPLE